jgi:hypothetical protein
LLIETKSLSFSLDLDFVFFLADFVPEFGFWGVSIRFRSDVLIDSRSGVSSFAELDFRVRVSIFSKLESSSFLLNRDLAKIGFDWVVFDFDSLREFLTFILDPFYNLV